MLGYREDQPEAAAEIDLESRYREKTGRLATEIQKLNSCCMPAESEARVVGETEVMKGELEELKSRNEGFDHET